MRHMRRSKSPCHKQPQMQAERRIVFIRQAGPRACRAILEECLDESVAL